MAKRGAASKLDHDNWDEDEEGEEAGQFIAAKKDVLAKREIKKAKRKGPSTESNGEEPKESAFKGFSGFSFTAGSSSASFNFKPMSNGSTTSGTTAGTTTLSTSSSTFGGGSSSGTSEQSSKYLHQLKNLNQSVNKWITDHVDKNPYCILTPIFKDYEKHLEELEKKYPDHSKGKQPDLGKKSEAKSEESSVTSPPSTFTFGAASKPAGATTVDPPTSVETTSSSQPTTGVQKPLFSFGTAATGTSSGIFGGGTTDGKSGFSFAVNKPAESTNKETEEEYVPPQNEVETVKEDEAFYTKRCKLYYKKGDAWADRGVGNLHLKKMDDKSVLLVRADTNLGNILLNILLNSSIPVNRQGKNNVMVICVPNPPLDEKNQDDQTPVSMLIRVKTAEDADELYEKMKECKGD